MRCLEKIVGVGNLNWLKINNKSFRCFSYLCLVGLWLGLCQPLFGQGTLAETATAVGLQEDIDSSIAQPATPKAATPLKDSNELPKPAPDANAIAGQQGIEKLEKVAQKLMQSMQSGRYDQADFSAVWNTIVPKDVNFSDGINALCKPVFDQFGKAEKLGEGQIVGPNRAVFPVQFTEGTANMTVSLDQQDKIVEWTLTPAVGAPVVVKTSPQAFANDVEPSLGEITVTFDQPMMDASWSWTGAGDTYPKTAGQPSYDQSGTTCSLPVSLEPGKVYWVGINSPSYQNFKSASGVPARQYVILFATKGSDGKPTPIPADMLKEAQAINEKTEPPANEVGTQKDTDAPDINDFNSFQRELNRINIETKSEEEQWLGRLERKVELARAIDELVAAQLRFIRKLAESEDAEQTTKAIDLVLRQRQDRLNKLVTKIENETRQERQQSTERRERRPLRGERQDQTERPRLQRRTTPAEP